MRVLVTGSAGHIGQWQVKALRDAGYEVRTLDRVARSRKDDWEHIPGDLRDLNTVRRAVDGVDAVAHLGAIANDRRGMPDEVFTINVVGTWNVLQACMEANVPRVVFFSSVNALGNFGGHRPSAYLPIDDAYPRHPMSTYQLTKHLGEETCRSFTNKYDMVTICLRPMFVSLPEYGHWWGGPQNSERRIEFGRSDYWAYVDVRDVCDATLLALTNTTITHDAFLLAADDTTLDIPSAELTDRYYPDTPWRIPREEWLAENPYRTFVDCSHAKTVLGWQPKRRWRDE